MEYLTNDTLKEINGGISKTIMGILGFGLVLLVSVIYGFVYPNKC